MCWLRFIWSCSFEAVYVQVIMNILFGNKRSVSIYDQQLSYYFFYLSKYSYVLASVLMFDYKALLKS